MASITTEPAPATAAVPAPPPALRPYRITVDVYERIAASGALDRASRVFLWKGQLVEKEADVTKKPPHVIAVNELRRSLGDLLGGLGYFVEQDQPLTLNDESVPEPDLKCVRGTTRDYATRAPTAADCPLVAEVSDSSLAVDSGEMLRAYAAAGVAVYWVVNIPGRRIDVYSGPSGPAEAPGYANHTAYLAGEEVPVVLDGREVGRVAVADVLP